MAFTSFQDYFSANKDTEEATAQKLAQQAKDQAGKATAALRASQDEFQQGLKNGASTNTGPGSIADTNSFQNAANQANTAETNLNQLTGLVGMGGVDAQGNPRGDVQTLIAQQSPYSSVGAQGLSGNLVGSAGQQEFQSLRNYFHPGQDLSNAVTQSAADAAAAQKATVPAVTVAPSSGTLSNFGPPGIPDSVTTVDQAIVDGYSQDQIVKKFGYAAYSDSVGQAFGRGK